MSDRHLTKTQLEQLLNSDEEKFVGLATGIHLKRCGVCQQKLITMAAKRDTWSKTAKYLQDPSCFGSSFSHVLPRVSNQENAAAKLNNSQSHETENVEWLFTPSEWLDPPRHPELLGAIGRYDIEREVGRGGMGVVYKAYDRELHRPLAIKVLAPHLAGQGTARKRFAKEAIAAAGIIHPNVIAVHGVNHQGRLPYIVMPFVDGISLQTLVECEGPISEIAIIRISQQIAAGLTAAHAQGLVHRDIKPANILIEAGVNRVLITDFGLAQVEDNTSMTQSGKLVGTLNYMSPEQAKGKRADCRSDLFSLGSLIYFLASGRLPFRSENSLGVINRILNEEPAPVRQLNNQVSETLGNLIQRLMQKNPNERFQTSAELHETLTEHLAYLHQPDVLHPPKIESISFDKESDKRESRFSARMKTFLLLFLCVGIGILAILYSSNWFGERIQPHSDNSNSGRQRPSRSFYGGKWTQAMPLGSSPGGVVRTDNRFDSRNGLLLIENGQNFLELKRYDQAFELFKEAEQFAWCAGSASFQLGCVWALKGDPVRAMKALGKAVDHGYVDLKAFQTADLNSIRSREEFSTLLSKAAQMRSALIAIESEPADSTGQEFDRAEAVLRGVLERNADNEEATVYLAYLLHRQQRYAEALDWHQKTIRTKKYSPIGHYNLSCYYALHKQPEKALGELERSIELGLAYLLDPKLIKKDADLDSIRSNQRYRRAFNTFRLEFDRIKE